MNEFLYQTASKMLASNQALLLLTSDSHASEYIPNSFKDRAKISGFKGSAGSLLITAKSALLITDGRYEIAAQEQAHEGIKIAISRDFKGIIKEELKRLNITEIVTRFDAINYQLAQELEQEFTLIDAKEFLQNLYKTPIDGLQFNEIYALPSEFALINSRLCIEQIKSSLNNGEYLLISALDDIAYLLNLRGSDIHYNPVFFSYFLISQDEMFLFANGTFCKEARAILDDLQIKLLKYEQIFSFISAIKEPIMANFSSLSYELAKCIKSPKSANLRAFKEFKNSLQIAAIKKAHLIDAACLARFYCQLEGEFKKDAQLSEGDIKAMLLNARKKAPYYISESFAPIVAAGQNAALPHYDGKKNSLLKDTLLIDCGAQYLCGTTDITRTFCFKSASLEFKKAYTTVLKAHIALASARLLPGVKFSECDAIARAPMRAVGADYEHGTGHGVGYCGCVHEGIRAISPRCELELEPGWVGSIEPGWYEKGSFGIRLEGLYVCELANEALIFRALSMYPFEYDLIDKNLLNKLEIKWLKDYHAEVLSSLKPLCDANTSAFIEAKCRPFLSDE